ncbi:DNA translocase FtsK [Secundilactobacillus hailunensis]|uniref:DNA translocase FtsK n=1 Tax=Secundilactobacillus hailunensis TaxID=2559923 RepID=A0ABW1T6Z1_9LACO|nr:DNA translocase FtsK [Secundilactobacillus hailunensis]
MNHYDGPAFYRRYRRPEKSAQEPASLQFKDPGKQSHETSEEPAILRRTEAQRQELLQHEERRQQEEQRQREERRQRETQPVREVPRQSKRQSQDPDERRNSTPFRPTKIPKQLHRSVKRQPKIDYGAIIKRYFQKEDSDVILFDDGSEPLNQDVEQAQPQSTHDIDNSVTPSVTTTEQSEVPEQTPEEHHTHDQEPVQPNDEQSETEIPNDQLADETVSDEPVDTEQPAQPATDSAASTVTDTATHKNNDEVSDQPASSADGQEVVQPQPNQPQIEAANASALAAKPVTELKPEQTVSDPQSTTPVQTADKQLEPKPVEPKAPTAKESVTKTPAPKKTQSKPESQPEHGLGHSLGDILQEENTSSQMNKLALFHDKPTAKPVSEVNSDERGYQFPSTSLLTKPVVADESALDEWIEHQGEVLDETLQAFHVDAHVVDWTVGPTVTQFQVHLALGVKVNKITNLTDDLKLALAAKDIRIEAPIPGKTTVGIEIPNPKTRPVMLSEVLGSKAFKDSKSPLTVALGVDLFGQPRVYDLRRMPHGLIAGATGSGKSVFINSLLISLLYKATPAQLRLLLIDPKAVELAPYDGLPHLLSPVISDSKAAAAALKWAVKEMDDRYDRLAAAGVRNIEQYNERAELTDNDAQKLPYIVIVIDELADLMMMASSEVQDYIVRITQKARAAGIHLLIATQRPSVDIVTGTIKNNIPTRVAFMVSSQVDSRTIIDTSGAERLLGKGDMLFLGNGASQPVRLQGTYVDKEVDRVTDFVRTQGKPHYAFDPDGLLAKQQVAESQDELLPEVLDYIVQEKTVSTSKLQRVFSIGYNRSANLIDTLEDKQYISAQNGSKPRDVFLTEKQLAEMRAPRTD